MVQISSLHVTSYHSRPIGDVCHVMGPLERAGKQGDVFFKYCKIINLRPALIFGLLNFTGQRPKISVAEFFFQISLENFISFRKTIKHTILSKIEEGLG